MKRLQIKIFFWTFLSFSYLHLTAKTGFSFIGKNFLESNYMHVLSYNVTIPHKTRILIYSKTTQTQLYSLLICFMDFGKDKIAAFPFVHKRKQQPDYFVCFSGTNLILHFMSHGSWCSFIVKLETVIKYSVHTHNSTEKTRSG